MVTITLMCEVCHMPVVLQVFIEGKVNYRHDKDCLSPRVTLLQEPPPKVPTVTEELQQNGRVEAALDFQASKAKI